MTKYQLVLPAHGVRTRTHAILWAILHKLFSQSIEARAHCIVGLRNRGMCTTVVKIQPLGTKYVMDVLLNTKHHLSELILCMFIAKNVHKPACAQKAARD